MKEKRAAIYVRVSTSEQDTALRETELRQYAESRGWSCVWALDRLARSLKQLLSIAEECGSLGVDLVSLKQSVDTTGPAGRLTFQILGAVAEFERELLRERVRAGMAQAKRTGKHVGRPALRTFQPTEVDRMRQLRSNGTSVRKLAKDFETTQWMVARLTAQPSEQVAVSEILDSPMLRLPQTSR
jgi:DNA invertase Pin-like site-specific DNA recombinase